MEDCCVHHVEFGVRNGEEFQRKFIQHYKFSLAATRFNQCVKQWLLTSGKSKVLLTQELANSVDDQYFVGWQHDRDQTGDFKLQEFDSVFNVALKVKNLETVVENLSRSSVEILRPIRTVKDKHGTVSYAVVKSIIGNVVHTLIQDDCYSGLFLPGFKLEDNIRNKPSLLPDADILVTHFDHVTFACNCGDSNSILDWYSRCFGMRRFLINRDEDEQSGFVIDTDDIGLRLKAFEYWKCAETGLSYSQHPDSIKFVIAEALPEQGPNQVDTFLHDHKGAGIQHLGLHTPDIIYTVSNLKDNGVEFAEPPYTYYTEVGKLEEICDVGQNIDILREHGVLVDAEADPGDMDSDGQQVVGTRYLMQKFTKPLFDKNTFFLEIIQRVGARGFGSGNITALWRSVQAYINSKEKQN